MTSPVEIAARTEWCSEGEAKCIVRSPQTALVPVVGSRCNSATRPAVALGVVTAGTNAVGRVGFGVERLAGPTWRAGLLVRDCAGGSQPSDEQRRPATTTDDSPR